MKDGEQRRKNTVNPRKLKSVAFDLNTDRTHACRLHLVAATAFASISVAENFKS